MYNYVCVLRRLHLYRSRPLLMRMVPWVLWKRSSYLCIDRSAHARISHSLHI